MKEWLSENKEKFSKSDFIPDRTCSLWRILEGDFQ